MTTEIVIMNSQAVALAADSAVTTLGNKIFNSANKLYQLAPGHSVGILVFNNASFMNIPWEIIIKMYRIHLSETNKRFGSLEEYGNDFLAFLRTNEGNIVTQEQQDTYFQALLEMVIEQDIKYEIQVQAVQFMMNTGAKIDDASFAALVNETIEKLFRVWNETEDLIQDEAERDLVAERMTKRYRRGFQDLFSLHLGSLPITSEHKEKLWQVCVYWLQKRRWFESFYSGLVFAGYGNDDLYPSCKAYQLETMMCEHMKLEHGECEHMSWRPGQAVIMPFGQSDIIRTLLSGINPEYANILAEQFSKALSSEIPSDAARSQKIHDIFRLAERAAWDKLTTPILAVVSMLPKDELASMAETLVNVTSFMRHVSSTQETVGGPVDVAIISKKGNCSRCC